MSIRHPRHRKSTCRLDTSRTSLTWKIARAPDVWNTTSDTWRRISLPTPYPPSPLSGGGLPFRPPPIVPHVGRGLPDTSRHLGHVGIGIFKQRIFSLSCLRTQLWLQDANAQALCCLVGAQPLFWFSSSNLRGLAPWDIPIRCVSAGTADGGAFCCSASSLVHPLVTIACTPTLQLFHGSLRGRCLDTVYTIDLVEAPCERTHV